MSIEPVHNRVELFLSRFAAKSPFFFEELKRTMAASPALFCELAEPMLEWAEVCLGPNYADPLIDGYCSFVVDVNRSQRRYETAGHYLHSSYREVFENAYNSEEFMGLYHWGVFVTTFAWKHHVRIYGLFRDSFLAAVGQQASGSLLDLGCGSGIWHLLAMPRLPGWSVTAVDISQTSIDLCREMTAKICPQATLQYVCGDALETGPAEPADAGISCFLLEHLENPGRLLSNLSLHLKPKAFAFVTCALTAAEYDHIFEFRRESEPILLAEEAGFRVVEVLSSASMRTPESSHFLPRSMAMVLQKRHNAIW